MPKTWKPLYSGKRSKLFWTCVWSFNKSDPKAFDRLYDLGCQIQELEAKVQRELDLAKKGD